MSVLGLLKKVKVQTLSFENHPCKELDQEQMIHYLNGLALITNEDETVCEKEKEYLSILINSFGLSEDMLETFVNFAENPDEKLILDMMQSFMSKDIKYNFMVDAMIIASIDGNFDDKERAIVSEYFEMFKITKNEAKDLRYIYEMFYTQNGNALFRYFGKQRKNDVFTIKLEHFQYLLDYYQIDMKYELQEEEKNILTFEFFKPTFSNGGLADEATEIMTKPVSNAQFCLWLNSAFIGKTIEFNGDGHLVESKTKDLLMDLAMSDIEFVDNTFVLNSSQEDEKKITGLTYVAGELFATWASENNKEKYNISHYYYNSSMYVIGEDDYNTDVSSFTNIPLKEIVYSQQWDGYYKVIKLNNSCLYFNSSSYSSSIDKTFHDKETSFRLMKLPEGEA